MILGVKCRILWTVESLNVSWPESIKLRACLPRNHKSLPPTTPLRLHGPDDGLMCYLSRTCHKYQVLSNTPQDNRWLWNLSCLSFAVVGHPRLKEIIGSNWAFNITLRQVGLFAKFKHINKQRKRNLQGFLNDGERTRHSQLENRAPITSELQYKVASSMADHAQIHWKVAP